MKYLSFTLLFWSFAHILYAQSEQNPEPFGCANQLFWPEFFKNAENAARRDSLESGWQQFSALAQKPADQVLTIPVVFHIIHNNGPENISNAQVLQGLKWLNDAFQNIGYYDQGSGAVTGIQFCLAQRTPQGAASTGILRVQNATLTDVNLETEDLSLKNLSRYFPFHYINIWVVRDVCNSQSCSPGGYAYYPAAHGNLYDGIVIEAKTLGTEEWRMSTLIHEMGHYLGLYHTFEGGCTNNDCLTDGDRICDTPPDQSTAAVPCDQTINSCNTDTQSGFATDQADLNTNYMDYTNYQCVHDFTQGQADRMNFVLTTIRKTLLESKGCAPPCTTTTTSTFTISPTSPVAAGTTVTFTSTAQNAASLLWKVSGQNIGTNTTATYTFDQLGTIPVGLIAQPVDALSCNQSSTTKVVEVYCGIDAAFNVGATILQPGQTALISNQSQGATTYEWYINDVLQTGQLTSVSFNQPGTYLIRLVAKNAWCQDENTVGVQVTPQQNNDDCSERLFEWYFDSLKVVSMVNLVDSGYVVALNNPDTASVGSYLLKINAKGDKVWTKQFPIVFQTLTYYTKIRKLRPGFHNGFWMLGEVFFTSNQASVNSGIVKMTSDGDVIWSKKLNVGNSIVQLVDMVELPSGNLAVCGVKTDIPGELYSCYLIMLDANGSKLWERMWKTDNLDALQAISIVALSEGGVAVLCKKLPLEGAVIRINEDGTEVWRKRINVNNLQGFQPTGITQVLDRSIYVCGTSNTEKAGYVFKLTPEGTLSWARRFAVGTTDFGFGSVIPSNVGNGVRLAGWMPDDDLGPSPDGFLMTLSEDAQFYSLTKSSSRLDDRITLLSGSFVACGSTLLPSGKWRGTLLRTNANGFYGFCPQDPALVTSTAHNTTVNNINVTTGSGLSLVDGDVTIAGFSISPLVNCQYSCSEICGNNLDDDLDGLFDCLDDDCDCEADACNPKSSNVWMFGNNVGLDFNETPPAFIPASKAQALFSASSICDENGQLLFYTDGKFVYNRFHEVMTNGNLTLGEFVECVITPVPNQKNLYQLWAIANGSGVTMYIIDMSLNSGKGDVISPITIFPYTTSGFQLAATKTCDNTGYWVTTITKLDNLYSYLSFRSDANGLMQVGYPVGIGGDILLGEMKFTPDGKGVVRTIGPSKSIEIADFDPEGGKVANFRILQRNDWGEPRGVEFSPDGRLMYISCAAIGSNSASALYQFDLTAGNFDAIRSSAQLIYTKEQISFNDLELAPNGKIYLTATPASGVPTNKISVIQQPNVRGAGCQFEPDGLIFPTGATQPQATNGLPNFPSQPRADLAVSFLESNPDSVCYFTGNTLGYTNFGCTLDSVRFTSTPNIDIFNSNDLQVEFFVTFPGTEPPTVPDSGYVVVQTFSPCGTRTDTAFLYIRPYIVPKELNLGPDRVICQNGTVKLNAGSGFSRYKWNDGSSDSTLTTLLPGVYWVKVWSDCSTDIPQIDTVRITVEQTSILNVGPNLNLCKNTPLQYTRPAAFQHWDWSPATPPLSCDTCQTINLSPEDSGVWYITANNENGCFSTDTLTLTVQDTVLLSLDTTVCANERLMLYGASLPSDTTAYFFFPATGAGCDTLLTVQVMGLDISSTTVQTTICFNEQFDYFGQNLPADTTAIFTYSDINGCDSIVTVQVNSFPVFSVALPKDTTIRIADEVPIKAQITSSGNLTLNWQPTTGLSCNDCPNPVARPLVTTQYVLEATDANGCVVIDSMLIRVVDSCQLYIPNAFTPNGDGNNDYFYPATDPCVSRIGFWQVRSRWGAVVFERAMFEPNVPNLGWDGRVDGADQPADVFVWRAEFEYYNGKKEVRSGQVTLVR